MKTQQIEVKISEDFNLPMGHPPFNYRPKQGNSFHPCYWGNPGANFGPSVSLSTKSYK